MTRELQTLVQALRGARNRMEESHEQQKKQLGIEVAAEILVQTEAQTI